MSTTEHTESASMQEPASTTLLGAPEGGKRGLRIGRDGSTFLTNLVIAVAVLIVGILVTYILPESRLYPMGQTMAYFAVAAGLTVLVGLSGQLSLGHAALMAVGGYAAAFTQNYLYNSGFVVPPPPPPPGASARFGAVADPTAAMWTLPLALLVGVVAALAVGALVGLAAARLRGPYLAGVTLSIGILVIPITSTFEVFNAGQGISVHIPAAPEMFGGKDAEGQFRVWILVIAVALVVLLMANLIRSRYGRSFRAVRDDEVAAQLSGINVARTQVVAFIVSAGTAGLGGGLLVYLSNYALPGFFGVNQSLLLVLAVVIGGLGTLPGALWGVLIVVFLPVLSTESLQDVSTDASFANQLTSNVPLAIFGLVLIVVTIAARGGIQNLLVRLYRKIRSAAGRSAAAKAS